LENGANVRNIKIPATTVALACNRALSSTTAITVSSLIMVDYICCLNAAHEDDFRMIFNYPKSDSESDSDSGGDDEASFENYPG
jgi:hypothetical protein